MRSVALLGGMFALALIFLGIAVPAARATETRVDTLQQIDGIEDEIDVYRFPGCLTGYKLALIELGTAGDKDVYGGAFAKTGGVHSGIVVSRDTWLFSEHQIGTSVSLFDRYQNAATTVETGNPALLMHPSRPIELLMAIPMGKNALGFRLAGATLRDYTKKEEAGVTTKTKRTADQVELGVGYRVNGPSALDIGFSLDPIAKQQRTQNASGVDSSTEVKVKSSAKLEARWLAAPTGNGPYAGASLLNRSFSVKSESAGADESSKFEDRLISVEGGYAVHSKAKDSDKIANLFAGAVVSSITSKGPTVTGVGEKTVPSYLASDDSADIKALVMAGALAGEADIAGGLGALMGLHYVLYGNITENDNTTGKQIHTEQTVAETSDSSLWSLGLFYRIDALRIDASYGKEFLHNGPYLVSGNATKPLLARISARYAF